MTDFIKGISIGVISSIIFVFICAIARNFLYPFIQNFFHDTPNISGRWQIYYSDQQDENSVGQLDLKQIGNKLKGSAEIWRNRKGNEVNRELNFNGSIRGNQILGYYEDLKFKGQIIGSVLLKFMGDHGKKEVFAGKSMYCHPNHKDVDAYDLCVKR